MFPFWNKGRKNAMFYKGEIEAEPDKIKVDQIHERWSNDLNKLEAGHDYIQWLFPIPETGQNPKAQPLNEQEANEIKKDPKAMQRFIKSYKMMLHFYGMKLENDDNGKVMRAENWEEQFKNLNFSEHNFLRITRILKSLGELGLEHYKAPLLRFLVTEAVQHRTLQNTLDSCNNYWIPTLRDPAERERLKEHIRHCVQERQRAEEREGMSLSRHTGQIQEGESGHARTVDSKKSKEQSGKSSETSAVVKARELPKPGVSAPKETVSPHHGKTIKEEKAFKKTESPKSHIQVSQEDKEYKPVDQNLQRRTSDDLSQSSNQSSSICGEVPTLPSAKNSQNNKDDDDNNCKDPFTDP